MDVEMKEVRLGCWHKKIKIVIIVSPFFVEMKEARLGRWHLQEALHLHILGIVEMKEARVGRWHKYYENW